MKTLSKLLAAPCLALILSASALAADATEKPAPCTPTTLAWHCPGYLELREDKVGNAASLTWFETDEVLAERSSGQERQRFMIVKPSNLMLYQGVGVINLSAPALNPFNRFDQVFAEAMGALRRAFETGPSSVPLGESQREAQLDGKPAKLKLTRKGGSPVIEFELSRPDGSIHNGKWDPRRPKPWDAAITLEGWTDARGNAAPASIGAARQPAQAAAKPASQP
ncbi:hypothetical protein [Pelomonas sp. SE-A7]|uniref:hypothetical protein n=1 Tax=Pelomonas sp. SE-A7 TaxID=3054953 RepID=UPI00259CDB20|nr:hypothetical protein [Pelomonas sp. SE-A7]MDM4768095.1 hypothetical protein [Pelomonas sp. SE-A7]